MKDSLFVRAIRKQAIERTPIWMMRQAGRYLPEYRELRAKAGGFLDLCKNPQRAAEITLQPLNRFQLDAAIIFSDILTIPEAMGLGLSFDSGHGPRFAHSVDSVEAIERLPELNVAEQLSYVFEAIECTKKDLGDTPLIGFCGSPFTVATYMIEGGSSKNFAKTKAMAYSAPEALHQLLGKLAAISADYLIEQVRHGADVVMVFDTWGGVLSPSLYHRFSLAYMQEIVHKLKASPVTQNTPIMLFSKGANGHLESLAATGCDVLGVDWTIDIHEARQRVGHLVALQGNLDPSVLYADANTIKEEVRFILNGYGQGSGHIFNLGHGIHPEISPSRVEDLIAALNELSPQYHQSEGD